MYAVCSICVVERQLEHAEKVAKALPKLRVEHAGLLAKEKAAQKPSTPSEWKKKYFTLTGEHVKLLRRANVSWSDGEFGAPDIDPKRPFGNSSVPQDVYEILGWPHPSEEEDEDFFGDDGWVRAKKIVRELETALQIVLSAGTFIPGVYEAEEYHSNWTWSRALEEKKP
jgi:hypothetical protein